MRDKHRRYVIRYYAQFSKKSLSAEEELELIRNAPIMDVAAYFRSDLDLAVQLRVDQAIDDTYEKLGIRMFNMDVTVRPIEPLGNLYGFASVKIGNMTVDDFKIIENKDGNLFVGMPSKPDKSSTTGYRNTVHIEKGFKAAFDDEIIRKYYAAVEQVQSRVNNQRSAPENPPRLCASQLVPRSFSTSAWVSPVSFTVSSTDNFICNAF